MKAKNILILHGFEADPSMHWFPFAKEKFEKENYQVFVPHLPGGYFPKKTNWIKIIESYNPDENWILIGHSLGGVAILKYLENSKKPVHQVILIASPFDSMKFGALDNFFDGGFNWEKIQSNCPKFDILNEDADPAVPLDHGEKYANSLHGKLHVLKGYNHFHTIDISYIEDLINE